MKQNFMPVIYYPTTILFVDDNKDYLDSLSLILDKHLPCQTYDDADKAMTYLLNDYRPPNLENSWLLRAKDELRDHSTLDINVKAIQKEINNSNRFSQLSVVVADYAMPDINGLEFFKRIEGLPVKKLLLTGEADDKLGIQALNDRIIDKFIRKSSDNFTQVLNQAIFDLQREYFLENSKVVVNSLCKDPQKPCSLVDPTYIKLLMDTCHAIKPTEYYLLDSLGSYLFLNDDADLCWLIIKDNEFMYYHLFTAETEEASKEVIEKLKNKTHFPYFYGQDELEDQPDKWLSHLFPASYMKGTIDYYYSLIKETKLLEIPKDKIHSFNDFLEKLET